MPLEGLKSQAAFEDMRQNYIRELTKAIHMREKGLVASSQRFYHLTKLMDAMHDVRPPPTPPTHSGIDPLCDLIATLISSHFFPL